MDNTPECLMERAWALELKKNKVQVPVIIHTV